MAQQSAVEDKPRRDINMNNSVGDEVGNHLGHLDYSKLNIMFLGTQRVIHKEFDDSRNELLTNP